MTFDLPTANIDHNLPELSVGEISSSLKATVEKAFQRVRVRGEISGFKRAPSGHLYMTLKDNDAVLDAVCWKGTAARLNTLPNDGAEVIATGRLTTYAGRSKYQIVVESFDLAGEGALLKLLEDRRRRLAAEGLFDSAKKQVIPLIPEVIGLVTSPTGAVIRDILHRLTDRFPRRVLVWPVHVQGEGAAAEVAAAIEGFNRFDYHGEITKPDVLIVARGGGSIEDLWAFNEELVIRAAANSRIPLISAIGHETDNTLIDFAADLRAPTPSAAAEMAVPVRNELLLQVNDKGARLNRSTIRFIDLLRLNLDGLARVLPDPRHALEERAQRLDDWDERFRNSLRIGLGARRQNLKALTGRLQNPKPRLCQAHERLSGASRRLKRAMGIIFKDNQRSLSHAAGLLETMSFERVLERGFVLISDIDGNSIGSVKKLKLGDEIGVGFADGEALVTVTETSDIARERLPSKRQRKLL